MTGASGFVSILPQLEMQRLHDQLDVARGGLWTKNTDDLTWLYSFPAKAEGIKVRVPLYVCPSDTSDPLSEAYQGIVAATASYAFVQGTVGPGSITVTALKSVARYENDGMFLYVTRRRASEIADGLSGTLMIGEVRLAHDYSSINLWTYARTYADALRTTANPLNTPPEAGEFRDGRQNGAFASEHPGGAVFAYADGHVEFLHDDIELWTYRALSTIAGEELR
jgi:prepilin-type processing-associated H-X9-DG protein